MSGRPPRISGFSYVGLYRYFLTICCHRRRSWFADHEAAAWLALQIVQRFPLERFDVVAYRVMPDHVHMLLEGLTEGADLRAATQGWKQNTGFVWKKRAKEQLWQSGYYDYVLRDEDSTAAIVKYIVGNPVRAGLVSEVEVYPFTGSSRYRLEELSDSVMDWHPPRGRT